MLVELFAATVSGGEAAGPWSVKASRAAIVNGARPSTDIVDSNATVGHHSALCRTSSERIVDDGLANEGKLSIGSGQPVFELCFADDVRSTLMERLKIKNTRKSEQVVSDWTYVLSGEDVPLNLEKCWRRQRNEGKVMRRTAEPAAPKTRADTAARPTSREENLGENCMSI